MKRILTGLIAVIFTATIWAQSPGKISYQAVIRDSNGDLVKNQTVGLQISILQGSADGTAVYTEAQTPETNANGLVSIEIGDQVGFEDIDWANGPYFIKTEADPAGGIQYSITGTSQILSVPYALYAEQTGIIDYNSLINKPAIPTQTSDLINDSGFLTAEVDNSVTNELQVINIIRDTIFLSNGGFVKLPNVVTSVQIINDSLYVTYQQGNTANEGYVGRGTPGSSMAVVNTDSVSAITYTTAMILSLIHISEPTRPY